MMKAIVARSLNGVIGNQGSLPWKCPEDLRYFWRTVGNKPLLMGFKTWLSMPKSMKNLAYVTTNWQASTRLDYSTDQVIFIAPGALPDVEWCVGGASTFDTYLPHIRAWYVNTLNIRAEGDCHFNPLWLEGFSSFTQTQTDWGLIETYWKG